jgi:hypothetical protein
MDIALRQVATASIAKRRTGRIDRDPDGERQRAVSAAVEIK